MPLSFLSLFIFLAAVFPSGALAQPKTAHPSIDNNKIGCVFPLSGRYGFIGQRALKGALAATGVFGSLNNSAVELVVVDSGSNSANLRDIFRELVEKEGVAVVIGPELSSEIREVSLTIRLLEIPSVVFPVSSIDLPQPNPYLVEFSYSLEKQAEVLARYAVGEIKLSRLGILHPRNRLGEVSRDAFIKAVKERGGDIRYLGSYDPQVLDISKEIALIRSSNLGALFIPDSGRESAEIVNRLKQEPALEGLMFLGPSAWNSESFLGKAGRQGGRVVLTDYFYPGDSRWASFAVRFKELFDEEPGVLEYQVFQAVNIVARALKYPLNIDSREQVLERLVRDENNPFYEVVENPGGGLTLSPRAIVLEVKGGSIVRLK